jgi:predicted secreted protein
MADYKSLFPVAMIIVLALSTIFGSYVSNAAEIRVCPEGCSNSSIQNAVNAAESNDSIVVQSGIYREGFVVGRPIYLEGRDSGSGRPMLSPENGRIILAGQGSLLQGFRFSGAKMAQDPGDNCILEVVFPARIYLNDFPTVKRVCPDVASNWNSSRLFNYQFESKVFRSRLGNYWADYAGKDKNGDGIGDEPQVLDEGNIDYFPLMQPVDSYRISDEKKKNKMEDKMELIRAKQSEPFNISLQANPTTGYKWYADYDYNFLRLDSERFEKEPSDELGSGGISIFAFLPLKPGKATISLVYKRPWENIVADVRTFQVEISL